MSLSPYVFPVRDTDEVHLFNSANGAILSFPHRYFDADGGFLSSLLTEEERAYMEENQYFIDCEEGCRIIETALAETSHRLTVSVEITHKCNFSCSYCYQKGMDTSCHQTYENIELLLTYIERVYAVKPFRELVLVILGGEPALERPMFETVTRRIKEFCTGKDIYWYMGIDTNGYETDYLPDLFLSDEMYLTIPLTERSHHNVERRTKVGEPTYDRILDNINRLHERAPEIGVTIRHNTSAENVGLFEAFIRDLAKRLTFRPRITLNYTLETEGVDYRNPLSYNDFVRWCSTTAIDILVKYGFPVVLAPNMYYSNCQTRQEYSIKLFNDGRVGACALYFNHKSNPTIRELLDDPGLLKTAWDRIKDIPVTSDPRCRTCRRIFLCNGGRLPCYYRNGISPCDGPDGIVLYIDDYVKRYLKYKDEHPELFTNFDEQELFR